MNTRSTLAATVLSLSLVGGTVHGQGWPEIFDPLVLRTLSLEMTNQDRQTIQHDETFGIDVPTLLWEFRAPYSQILNDLVRGPFREANLHAFLDALEPVLSDALAADPNNQLGGPPIADFFASRKAWMSQRVASVSAQIEGFVPCGPADPWVDLGGGTTGAAGTPTLARSGPLTPLSSLESLGTDGAGEIHEAWVFPPAASGTDLWFQVGIVDASVQSYGVSMSNGVQGTVP